MIVHIICVGKLKERYYADACAEYLKRLGRFGKVTVGQVPDESEPANASPADIERIKDAEADRILREIKDQDHVMALAVEGTQQSSEEFAGFLSRQAQLGRICFVIGGSNGLGQAVYARANGLLSFSKSTLPHQLARVVLLEQLYRAATIGAGHKYHK